LGAVNRAVLAVVAVALLAGLAAGVLYKTGYRVVDNSPVHSTLGTFPGSIQAGDLLFTFEGSWLTDSVRANRSGILIPVRAASSGDVLFIVNLTLSNVGSNSSFFDPFNLTVSIFAQGREYEGMYYTSDWFSLLGFLEPQQVERGYILFEIPEGTNPSELALFRVHAEGRESVGALALS